MQETHSSENIEKYWEAEWGGKIIYSHGTSAARGVAVCLSRDVYRLVSNIYSDNCGRIVIFDLTSNDQTVTFAAIYAPNVDSPYFFDQLRLLLVQRHEHKIVIGDFNLTMNVENDRLNTYNNNNRALAEIENMMDEFQLKDTWRTRNEGKQEFSWTKKESRGERKASRLDFALVSGGIDQNIELIQYLSSIMTDHRALYMALILTPFERGTGYWKLYSSLLQDSNFVQDINNTITTIIATSSQKTSRQKWENIKLQCNQVPRDSCAVWT